MPWAADARVSNPANLIPASGADVHKLTLVTTDDRLLRRKACELARTVELSAYVPRRDTKDLVQVSYTVELYEYSLFVRAARL